MRISTSLLSLLVLASLPGCDRLDVDDPDEGALAGGGCKEEVTVLASAAEMSALGFAADDVLAVAAGSHASPMTWTGGIDEGSVKVAFGPESGVGSLTIDVKHAGGEVRFIHSTPEESGELDGYDACDDRLEVDVEVSVVSDGGALAESFTAPLRATSRGIGRISHDIAVDEFAGSFAVTNIEPANATVGAISFSFGISGSGLFGGATTIVETQDGDVSGAGFVDVASWPGGQVACDFDAAPVGFADAVAGFSANDALALIEAAGPLSLKWQGSEATELTLVVTPGAVVCANDAGDSAGSLRIPSELAIKTADGRWDGVFAVDVIAAPTDDGTLAGVTVEISEAYAATVAIDQFEATFGLADVDLTGYDEGGMTFRADFMPAEGGATMTGAVTVLAVTKPNCSDEPGAGCEGNEYSELDMADLASE